MEEERVLRIGIVLAGHLIWLSAGALRIVRGHREHSLEAGGKWWLEYYPPLVWLPLLIAVFVQPWKMPLPEPVPTMGLGIAIASALLAAWAMWSLGRSYGICMDLFEGHRLKTSGVYALSRHPMYLGIIGYHLGTSLALESLYLLMVTAIVIVPFTVARIVAEDEILARGFGAEFAAYRARTRELLPLPR